ncbi:hypothetical protein V9L05_05585 [Bernardetia sp. Wsw4-3y2]
MKVYESSYLTIEYIQEGNYQVNTWLPNSKTLDEATFKKEVSEQTKIAVEKSTSAFITDASDFLFTIHPETQKWVNQTIFTDMREVGVKKLALLSSSDIIAQLSIEQLIDEDTLKGFASEFFDDKEKAREWILSSEEEYSSST